MIVVVIQFWYLFGNGNTDQNSIQNRNENLPAVQGDTFTDNCNDHISPFCYIGSNVPNPLVSESSSKSISLLPPLFDRLKHHYKKCVEIGPFVLDVISYRHTPI